MEQQASPIRQYWALVQESGQQWREWLFARRVCREALAAYHAVRRTEPKLHGDALYAAVIAQRTRLDGNAARHLLELAHASREDWGNERPASFRDIVMYMIVTEYLGRRQGVRGMSIDLAALLDRRLPPAL